MHRFQMILVLNEQQRLAYSVFLKHLIDLFYVVVAPVLYTVTYTLIIWNHFEIIIIGLLKMKINQFS